jgi:hypothetical protein
MIMRQAKEMSQQKMLAITEKMGLPKKSFLANNVFLNV